MLVATGSASSGQNGIVASTHPPRVIACGGLASSAIVVASLEPERRQGERLIEVGALAGRHAEAVLVGDVQRLALARDPSRCRRRRRSANAPLQLLHEASASWRDRCSCPTAARAARHRAPAAAAEQLPEQFLELLFGTAILVCHFSRLSDTSAPCVLR